MMLNCFIRKPVEKLKSTVHKFLSGFRHAFTFYKVSSLCHPISCRVKNGYLFLAHSSMSL